MTNVRTASRLTLAIVAGLALAACSAADGSLAATQPTPPVSPTVTQSLGPADVTIQAADGGVGGALGTFMPDKIEIKSGGVLRLDDTGTTQHNLTIDTSGLIPTSGASRKDAILIAVDLVTTSAEGTITLPPGTYRFYCTIDFGVAGHTALNGTGMVGTLVVH